VFLQNYWQHNHGKNPAARYATPTCQVLALQAQADGARRWALVSRLFYCEFISSLRRLGLIYAAENAVITE
jgi:hypothetical protein